MRLTANTLDSLAPEVARPGYDRAAQAVGIVHLGIGAFHRAHQAWYTDRAMDAGDRDWAITGVSLRSPDVAARMNPQDGLYTATERSAGGDATRLVGAVRDVLVAPLERERAIARLAVPSTHIVTLTITEKGYCRAPDGSLDIEKADASSAFSILCEAMQIRRDLGLSGLTLLSCDNLDDNGEQLASLLSQYLETRAASLVGWFQSECACPSTMVDRIVPATTVDNRKTLAQRIGPTDEAAVMTEPFSQWVIEDRFAGPRPRWENVGAELVGDVAPYEAAKLRLLNGAHSAIAYLGLARGHTFVHQAIDDTALRPSIERLMRDEALPTLVADPGQNLQAYIEALLVRFANPALEHRLIQIAMDGSQKIPQRWLATLADNQTMGRDCPVILAAIGAWIDHLRGANGSVDDPRAMELSAAARGPNPVAALFGAGGPLASRWRPAA